MQALIKPVSVWRDDQKSGVNEAFSQGGETSDASTTVVKRSVDGLSESSSPKTL